MRQGIVQAGQRLRLAPELSRNIHRNRAIRCNGRRHGMVADADDERTVGPWRVGVLQLCEEHQVVRAKDANCFRRGPDGGGFDVEGPIRTSRPQ